MKARRTSYALVLIALAISPSLLHAQSVTIGAPPRQVFCAGDQFDIPYTASGYSSGKNSFVLQLSDANGAFGSFQTIGSVRTTNSGVITAKLPTTLGSSSKYRMRVISSDPYIASADNGGDLIVGGVPSPRISLSSSDRVFAMVGEEMHFAHNSTNTVSVRWDFGPDASPRFTEDPAPTVSFSEPGAKKITLTARSIGGCEVTSVVTTDVSNNDYGPFVYVGTCSPKLPSTVKIDSFESHFDHRDSGPFWIVPGGTHDEIGATYGEYFVEPGGTLLEPLYFSVIYMKAGSSLIKPHRSGFVIFEQGASIDPGTRDVIKFECDNVEFDYSDAPPYKIEQAGVKDKQELDAFVYPNPASNAIYRQDLSERLIEARLYSTTGALVMTSLEPRGREIMSVRDVAPGLYNLELHFADQIRFQKILIQR